VLDATNPHPPMLGASGAEEVALRAPGARVVKAFNTVAAPVGRPGHRRAGAAEPAVLRRPCRGQAGGRRVDRGCWLVPVDVGRLEAAREVEALGRLLAGLAYGRGPGPVGYQLLTAAELSTAGG
jgi:predicted dinucleotide-binding enzyme